MYIKYVRILATVNRKFDITTFVYKRIQRQTNNITSYIVEVFWFGSPRPNLRLPDGQPQLEIHGHAEHGRLRDPAVSKLSWETSPLGMMLNTGVIQCSCIMPTVILIDNC